MASRYAIQSGNWYSASIWDNGSVPLVADDVIANGNLVIIDQNTLASSIRNTVVTPTVGVLNIVTAAMTSNSSSAGIVSASSVNGANAAYLAFDQTGFTNYWQGVGQTNWLSYQFPTTKVIKRYSMKGYAVNGNFNPKSWSFEGSNDGSSWTVLDNVNDLTFGGGSAVWRSGVLANTGSFYYYRININSAQSVANVLISELEMTESTGSFLGLGGGSFILSDCNYSGSLYCINGATLLYYTGSNTGSVGIGSTFNLSTGNSTPAIYNNSISGTLNIYGDIIGQSAGYGETKVYSGLKSATTNIYGSLYSTTTAGACVTIPAGSSVVSIYGNIYGAYGGGGSITGPGAGTTLNVYGNIFGGNTIYYSISTAAVCNINVYGNIQSTAAYPCINLTGASVFKHYGYVSASISSPAVISTSTSATNIMTGPFYNNNGYMAVQAYRLTINTGSSFWKFTTSNLLVDRTLFTANQLPQYPSASDVRSGISYASGSLFGTMAVPPPVSVAYGVAVDSGSGTAIFTADNVASAIWNQLQSNITISGSMGDRLKNSSTVSTTGEQLKSLIS